jgi:predicted Ser/Thr protein kinase
MTTGKTPVVDVQGATLVSAPGRGDAARSFSDMATIAAVEVEPATEELSELAPGSEIARYRIVARLGAGGMGVVYRAHDAQLDRDVALKLLRVGEDGSGGRARMLREAQAAAKIRHPNVVTVYDAGEVMNRVFIAMELIDGVTLKAYFRGRRRGWREVVEVMLGAGEGLAAAHAALLVHRDFKPDNVLVEAGGRVRVLDFGLARPAAALGPADGPAQSGIEGPTAQLPAVDPATATMVASQAPVLRTLTQTGVLVGTPAYMAPEQHQARGVDARTDQFSYCVTFYECLYGQRPFAGDTQAELTMNVLEGRLAPPRDRGSAPPEIFAALQRGLAVDPDDRWPALADLLAELRAIVRRHEPRDRRALWVAVGLALVAAGAGAMAMFGGDEPGELRRPAPVAAPPEPEPEPEPEAPTPRAPAPQAEGVEVVAPRANAAEVAALLSAILPEGTGAVSGAEGLRLVGPAAASWREAARTVVLAVDAAPVPRAPELQTQVTAPDGTVAVYRFAAAEFAARAAAVRRAEGVRVGASEALGSVLVFAPGDARAAAAALAEVEALLREARAPKVRAYCFTNTAMGDREDCHPTRAACEEDAANWLGAGTACHAKR